MGEPLFRKILIATDGSERNQVAVIEAIKIARACHSELFAAYVIDTSAYSSISGDVPVGDTYHLFENEAKHAFANANSLAINVNVNTVTLEGRPATELVKFAKEKNIDLIVIATQGKKGLERFLLGSVAEEIIRSAPCKVLVVK